MAATDPGMARWAAMKNDQRIYEDWGDWWKASPDRQLRTLRNMVPARMRYFTPIAQGFAGKRVLDVGCGGGFMADALARAGASVIGVDPSDGALAAARAHAERHGLAITLRKGTGESLPVDDASMDIAVCVDVLEHVRDVGAVCREIHRALKPGGLFLFDTINRNLLSRLIIVEVAENILRVAPKGVHDPALFITPRELRTHLEQAGFVVGEMTGLGPIWFDLGGAVRWARVPSTLLTYMGHAVKR